MTCESFLTELQHFSPSCLWGNKGVVSRELEALRLRLVAPVQRERGFLLLKKLHNGPASLSFDEGEICSIEDSADLQVFCPCRQSRPQYLQPRPILHFLSPLIVHHCLWTSSLSFSDFLWVPFPSLPSLQRPCNTHYEVTQSSPGCPETAPLPCPMSVCGATFADGDPQGRHRFCLHHSHNPEDPSARIAD